MITHPALLGTFTPYAILLSVCAGLGLYLSSWLKKGELPHLIDGGMVMLLFSLLGGRMYFILVNFGYYREHLLEIPQFWLGGLAWPGAAAGAALAVFLVHWIWKEPLGELADSYLPLWGVLAVGIWLAGWGSGIGYGPRTAGWLGIPVKDMFGTIERRWPLPIIGGLCSGAWTAGAIFFPLKRRRPEGTRGLLGAAGLMAINAALSFFRVDPAPMALGLRLESWVSLLALAVLVIGLYLLTNERKDDAEPEA